MPRKVGKILVVSSVDSVKASSHKQHTQNPSSATYPNEALPDGMVWPQTMPVAAANKNGRRVASILKEQDDGHTR